ncbi:pilus assembly protein PilQ [Neisseria elongata subsp. glycolytica ATCC 29315]|uniref:Type IV pilus biogenesis and competence protein PilQ n=1 Tax=Neisseria elongata subsp. glycolytica ATCC 29315 TaxID=546263 RepID=D4DTJ8_NEIEG|nr:type IV pilus secretin PilQ [Neisseria elongata]AJE19182.1 pilus assembly protein PilQ [Neisseria elongata subsp. glycolytica ATCC 29315]EFE48813.1 type IV pilus secretin PilQ [Neisseria elongata subsp. glycolytica ATCC 29315]SQH48945.1 PilQ [Neisseria elongata subsp. glycolytica]
MKKLVAVKIFPILGMTLAVQSVFAGNITDINVSTLPNNQKIVKVKFDKDTVLPSNSMVNGPSSRVALDFPSTGVALPQSTFEYADSLLNQVTAVKNGNNARVLLGLNRLGQYKAEVQGKEVWIYINEAVSSSHTTPSAQMVNSKTASSEVAAVTVDFRKSGRSNGIVEIMTRKYQGKPDIKQNNGSLTITLKNYPLPVQAQRNLDVTDFSTPVRNVILKRIGNDTQVVIKNQGAWAHSIKTMNDRLVIEITQKSSVEGSGLPSNQNKSFKGNKVSLDFQDVDVRTVLQILAKESGMNIVASDSVTGKMTLTLKDVPWDQALDLVMQARNLDMRKTGNVINVAPRDELLAKDKAILTQQREIDELGPLYSRTFQLKYKNVEEFRKILKLDDSSSSGNGSKTILSSRGSALIDPATNTLVITDNTFILQKFEKLIAELDVPARQVMVEARIVEAEDGFSRQLGVKFGYAGSNGKNSWGSNWANAGANRNSYVDKQRTLANWSRNPSQDIPALPAWTVDPNVNLPIAAATSSIALVHALSSGALGLELSAQQAQNKLKIVSTPRVLTQDRKEAIIEAGTEVPYQEASSSGATSTSFKKAVLGMTVTPNITPDGQIIMDIKINKDSVNSDCRATEPCINTQRLNTNVMVEDGGTLILGGIYQEENSEGVSKVPLLGDIPVVGNLFKSKTRSDKKTELLIFITPRIVDNIGSNLRY